MSGSWFTAANPAPEPHVPLGWRVLAFDSLDSTNAALRRIVEEGGDVSEGVMVWAKSQTAGRGRHGRTWVSPPGNVYVSVLIAAPERRIQAPEVGFLTAVAVCEAILELPRHNATPPAVTCKWPNDVLVDGKKVSGILPEVVAAPGGKSWIVLGIGINLHAVELDAAAYPVTALNEHHIDAKPARVLTYLSRSLAAWLEKWRQQGFSGIRAAWLERGPGTGTGVSVGIAEGTVTGTFVGLDEDGALMLDTAAGRRRIIAGDVLFGSG